MTNKLYSISFWFGYGLLTVIKLFTGVVGELGDPTKSLVIKVVPTIGNVWNMIGEENARNIVKYKGTWYFEKKYWLVTASENGFAGETLYYVLILGWWIIILILLAKAFRKRKAII